MSASARAEGRASAPRWLVPEVVQTSAMDCGPAALKSALEGFGVVVDYGRLREACRTTVDGTSIDTLESIARELGFEAVQTIVPVDHVLETATPLLPAVAVFRQPGDRTHFVVAWSRRAGRVQIMNPAVGRQWLRTRDFLSSLFVHSTQLPSARWREWAGSDSFIAPLQRRLGALGLPDGGRGFVDAALADPSWRSLARLDAAARMATGIVTAGGVVRGAQAGRLLALLIERSRAESSATAWERPGIPKLFWSVRPAGPAQPDADGGLDADGTIAARGAVLLTIRRASAGEPVAAPRLAPELHAPDDDDDGDDADADADADAEPADAAPVESGAAGLRSVLTAPAPRPLRELVRLLSADRRSRALLVTMAAGLVLSATGIVAEAVLLRSVVDVGRDLGLPRQRFGAVGVLAAFCALLLLLDTALSSAALWLGRQLELRLRVAFLSKLPRLRDDYLQSRPSSDMAERCHSVHRVRSFPSTAADFLRNTVELGLTTAAIIWLTPRNWLLALLAMAASVVVPLLFQLPANELDLRVRTHAGGLGRFYLDAMLGLTAIRSHSAERAVRRQHEGLLTDWARASQALLRSTTLVEAVGALAGLGCVAWLFLDHLAHAGLGPRAILLLYWLLNVPALGRQIAYLARIYPSHRNVTLRLLEPLGAPEDPMEQAPPRPPSPVGAVVDPYRSGEAERERRPAAIRFDGVRVLAAGHLLLDDIRLDIAAGEHLAIVGPSGAGKSTLVGLLLGWHRPAAGTLLVDGKPLDDAHVRELRRDIAWVDPAVQIWNRSVLDNLLYGAVGPEGDPDFVAGLSAAIRDAELAQLLKNMPNGLQTPLGEGGTLASGGEGQRVRLGRALAQATPRLVILDEPFRGLARAQRQQLMRLVRQRFRDVTLLCITHDVGETSAFDRVVLIEQGQVAEDAAPAALLADATSRYHQLFTTETEVREGLWSAAQWRRLRVERGQLVGS